MSVSWEHAGAHQSIAQLVGFGVPYGHMSDRFLSVQAEMESRKLRFGFSYRRMFSWLASVVLFSAIATFAVTASLGYTFTWQPERVVVQQTGTIQLNGPLAGVPVQVYMNGVLVSEELPARFSRLEPKKYTVELRRLGYQSWQQEVTLEPYQRVYFSPVMLVYDDVVLKPVPEISMTDTRFSQVDARNLELKNGSEVWLDETFVTRLSQDILSIRWLPGRDFMVLQDAAGLTLLAANGAYTQRIVSYPQTQETTFFFTEGGRVLVMNDGEQVLQAELYEYISLIDRLGAGRRTETP